MAGDAVGEDVSQEAPDASWANSNRMLPDNILRPGSGGNWLMMSVRMHLEGCATLPTF